MLLAKLQMEGFICTVDPSAPRRVHSGFLLYPHDTFLFLLVSLDRTILQRNYVALQLASDHSNLAKRSKIEVWTSTYVLASSLIMREQIIHIDLGLNPTEIQYKNIS
jgi:hypothetical protein